MKSGRTGILLLAIACSPHLWAADVNWSLALGADHRTSAAMPLSAGTRFQIGVFTGGFIPTSANTSSWAAHWQAVGDVAYNTEFKGLSAVMRVEEIIAPFAEGARLYIWGFLRTTETTSEWALATHSSWTFPSDDPLAFPVFINMAEGDMILGNADPSSGAVSTSAVNSPTVPHFTWEQWIAQYFFLVERGDPSIVGSGMDPDGDGLTNAMEYALGLDPKTPDSEGSLFDMDVAKKGASEVIVSYSGTLTVPDAWEIQTSQDLSTWNPVSPSRSFDLQSRRWTFIQPVEGKRFWRLSPKN